MPDYRGQEPKGGDYASLISKLDNESLKELMRGSGASSQSGHAVQAMLDASSAASQMASRNVSSRKGAFKGQASFQASMANGAAGHQRAVKHGSSGMNGFVYLGITAGLILMFALSGDPEFGIFCAAAFVIVTVAFISSRRADARRSAQKSKGPKLQ